MLTRREMIKAAGLAVAALRANLDGLGAAAAPGKDPGSQDRVSKRPPIGQRNFVSEAVEATIATVKRDIADAELAWLFENCYPNTLDTTVRFSMRRGRPDGFVITGDIPAMWLRDSTAQVWPYLPLAPEDQKLRLLLAGVVNRQTRCILTDPYANAFNDGPEGSHWESDLTDMKPELHERKWEIDSLCYPVRLAHGYWRRLGARRRLAGGGTAHLPDVSRATADAGARPLQVPARHRRRLRHRSLGRLWESHPIGRAHPLDVPSFRRRVHLSFPGSVKPVRGARSLAAARDLQRRDRRSRLRG